MYNCMCIYKDPSITPGIIKFKEKIIKWHLTFPSKIMNFKTILFWFFMIWFVRPLDNIYITAELDIFGKDVETYSVFFIPLSLYKRYLHTLFFLPTGGRCLTFFSEMYRFAFSLSGISCSYFSSSWLLWLLYIILIWFDVVSRFSDFCVRFCHQKCGGYGPQKN